MKVYECDRCGAYVEQRALELLRMPYRGIWRIGRRGHLCPERRAALERLEECAMWMGRCRPRGTAAPAHGEAAAGAAQQTYVDVRPALDAALASWDPMEGIRKLMLRSAVD